MSTVMHHFLHPHNCGELESPDGVGIEEDNPWFIRLRLAIKVEDGRIDEIRFKAAGCLTAVASMSALTDLVRHRRVDEALAATPADITCALQGVPREKVHCCELAIRVLRRAIWDYEARQDATNAGGTRTIPQ